MVVKTVSIFYICCMMSIVSSANEPTSVQPDIYTLVTKIKHATPVQKRLLLDALKVQVAHGVKFD